MATAVVALRLAALIRVLVGRVRGRGVRRRIDGRLGHPHDRFELERREQAWMRRQSADGSLLGW
jgi:hypothetical protein